MNYLTVKQTIKNVAWEFGGLMPSCGVGKKRNGDRSFRIEGIRCPALDMTCADSPIPMIDKIQEALDLSEVKWTIAKDTDARWRVENGVKTRYVISSLFIDNKIVTKETHPRTEENINKVRKAIIAKYANQGDMNVRDRRYYADREIGQLLRTDYHNAWAGFIWSYIDYVLAPRALWDMQMIIPANVFDKE